MVDYHVVGEGKEHDEKLLQEFDFCFVLTKTRRGEASEILNEYPY